jgi:hypothetical protein
MKTIGEVRETSDDTLLSLPDLGPGSVAHLRKTLGAKSPIARIRETLMAEGSASHAHLPTLVHARLLDIRWTPSAKSILNH